MTDWQQQQQIVSTLLDMPYGHSWAIERHVWRKIVPIADPLRQLMLAVSGHRPETERTPEDWFRFWLNGPSDDDFMVVKTAPYIVRLDDFSGTMVIQLPENECPTCHGRGFVESRPRVGLSFYRATVPAEETVTIERRPCDHSK